jgi:hypothetical protein
MERCAFCQAALDEATRFCWQCGHARTSMLLVEKTSPSQQLAPPARRCVVCGLVLPRGATVCGNCLSPQPADEDATLPGQAVRPAAGPQKRCAVCGGESPLWARFCGSCRQPFAPPAEHPSEITIVGSATETNSGTDLMSPALVAVAGEPTPWQAAAASHPPKPAAPPTSRQKSRQMRLKLIAALLVTALVVTTGGVTLAYFHTRPEPVLQVSSPTFVGNTPAGSPTSVLQVSGQRFSRHSQVTIKFDSAAIPAARAVPTDGTGGFRVNLTVPETWRYGTHTLTATDARGYTTRSGVRIVLIPRPVIIIQSQYHQDTLPAGSTTTRLHLTGKWFSYHSAITLLLDGQPAPGTPAAQSDAQGDMVADLTITDQWSQGTHTLTAQDAQGYATPNGQQLAIVAQGQASTPGPNGAPSDNASFLLVVTVQTQDPTTGETTTTQETLVITGQPDPNGGTVCQARDDGQPSTQTGALFDLTGAQTGLTYQETLITTCSGHYQGGQLDYTETATSDLYVLSNGLTCQASTPYTLQSLSGSFNAPTTSSGGWSTSSPLIECPLGATFLQHPAQQGNWSGTIQ